MFRITLVNWDPEMTEAASHLGSRVLGLKTAEELRALLEQFRVVDAVQNAEADPEIAIEVRRHKHLVRTGQGRLYLYDPRNHLEPALVLTPEEIIAELDGTAAAARTRAPFASAQPVEEEVVYVSTEPKPISPLRPAHRIALAAAAIGLAGFIAYPQLSAEAETAPSSYQPINDPQLLEAQRQAVAGVYMTGSQPGHYGIALAADGTMKLFQLNAQGAPSLIQDTYRLGRNGAEIGILTSQPGGAMRLTTRQTLAFCGDTYQRIP